MSGGHGIISSDIIPVLICFRPKGEKFLQRIMHIPRRKHVRRTWYKVDRHDTIAGSLSDRREDIFPGEPCASAGGNMFGTTWYDVRKA